jgi:alpha-1,3/alpha-1,6-mannosyltransferase
MTSIVFLHPDLGIGGAERLVVDAALALLKRGHQVTIITAHHDPKHAFQETTDGQINVVSAGDWLPRSIFGRCQALCASIRMIYITIMTMIYFKCDIVFLDQVSTPLLLLCMFNYPTLFYCHFPDLLLSQGRTGLKALYRYPLDWLEQYSTGLADITFVNSGFTKQVFLKTFTKLKKQKPRILYPSLNTNYFDTTRAVKPDGIKAEPKTFFLSINRYERKKNLALALKAYSELSEESRSKVTLIMAGGWDHRVPENVQHFDELDALVDKLGIRNQVEFLRSPGDQEKLWLLKNALTLIYTPANEHFGIVPLEAMYCETPVIAVNSGGPTETIVDGYTGWLRDPNSYEFSRAMQGVIDNLKHLDKVGAQGKERVEKHFSFQAFGDELQEAVLARLTGVWPKINWMAKIALAFHFALCFGVLYWMTFGIGVP